MLPFKIMVENVIFWLCRLCGNSRMWYFGQKEPFFLLITRKISILGYRLLHKLYMNMALAEISGTSPLPSPKYHICEFSHYLRSQKITFSTITLKGSILIKVYITSLLILMC